MTRLPLLTCEHATAWDQGEVQIGTDSFNLLPSNSVGRSGAIASISDVLPASTMGAQ